MFWDISPLGYPQRHEDVVTTARLVDALFDVLKGTFSIAHRACKEAALHGIGELAHSCPDRCEATVDAWLRDSQLDDELLEYAKAAAKGDIL
jgi:hypothetical protein